jgi:phosphatidyl-myo-inositol dimannoside synthase
MTSGRLAPEKRDKGLDEIMELLPVLSKQIPHIAYLIVGDGKDLPRLEAKAQALGVGDRVVFTGFIPEAEKADHYRLADPFVMPGRGGRVRFLRSPGLRHTCSGQ